MRNWWNKTTATELRGKRTAALYAPWLGAVLALALGSAGCSEDNPPAKKDTATEEDTEEPDATGGDATTGQDGSKPGDSAGQDGTAGDGSSGTDGDSTGLPDGAADADDATGPSDATETADAGTDAGGGDVSPDSTPKPKLPLPDCAQGNCLNCLNPAKCPVQQICVDGTTFANDCEAICKLQAFEGLDAVAKTLTPAACPSCAACATTVVKCNTQTKKCTKCENGTCKDGNTACTSSKDCGTAFDACATLKSGAKVTISLPCMASCMDVDPGVSVTGGACKSACSQPLANGGGACAMDLYQPVCAKEDGKSYSSTCALQNCDKSGCFALGSTAKSETCSAGAMTKECEGECFADAIKVSDTAKNCPQECAAVCGITKLGKGQSFRNECLAQNAGAKVGDCTGIAATDKDLCSANYFKNKPCCSDVNYGAAEIKQVCASRQSETPGAKDTWVTFRNTAEYKCLTTGDNKWVQQYVGPCICECSDAAQPVCGADGLTYTNGCQAKCYNGEDFDYKPGPC